MYKFTAVLRNTSYKLNKNILLKKGLIQPKSNDNRILKYRG